jgi:hypothetical protein
MVRPITALEQHRERIAKSANQSRVALQGLLFIVIIAALYLARDFLLPVVLALIIPNIACLLGVSSSSTIRFAARLCDCFNAFSLLL